MIEKIWWISRKKNNKNKRLVLQVTKLIIWIFKVGYDTLNIVLKSSFDQS